MFTREHADFLHKIVNALGVSERDKQDLHTELAVNTETGEEESDAEE